MSVRSSSRISSSLKQQFHTALYFFLMLRKAGSPIFNTASCNSDIQVMHYSSRVIQL